MFTFSHEYLSDYTGTELTKQRETCTSALLTLVKYQFFTFIVHETAPSWKAGSGRDTGKRRMQNNSLYQQSVTHMYPVKTVP